MSILCPIQNGACYTTKAIITPEVSTERRVAIRIAPATPATKFLNQQNCELYSLKNLSPKEGKLETVY